LYAARWFDDEAPPLTGPEAQACVDQQLADCLLAHDLFTVAALIPRRLGGDADARSLSADKKASRSLAYAYGNIARSWMAVLLGQKVQESGHQGPEAKRLGATVDIPDWIRHRQSTVERRGTDLVTYALRSDDKKLANVMANKFEAEATTLTRAASFFD
jgi:hypothetical protein